MIVQHCEIRGEYGAKCPLVATQWVELTYAPQYHSQHQVTKIKAACPAHAVGLASLGPVEVTAKLVLN